MGWYVYSNDFDKDLGPLLTEFVPVTSGDYAIASKLKAINPKKKFDEVWKGDVTYFMGKGRFEQPVTINVTSGTVKASLEYQMCSDLTGQCINYEQDIDIKFTAKEGTPKPQSSAEQATPVILDNPEVNEEVVSKDTLEKDSPFVLEDAEVKLEPQDFVAEGETESLWGFMVLAFLAGLAALITPCVFPMIPMTVSFFTGRSKKRSEGVRQAVIYGISIIAIYTVAGTAVAATRT
jgi:thiol:disulfide interchange protein DsbD